MNEEIFDVVDEHDRVLGQQPRRDVHRLGLRHRAVHILALNQSGQVFLQKRSRTKDRFPGTWDSSASGHVDAGEDYDTAAVRELKEELGWTVRQALRRLFHLPASPATDQEFVWVYRIESNGPFHLNPDEIEQGGWFTPEEITRWIQLNPDDFAGGFRSIWQAFCQNPIAHPPHRESSSP